MSEVRTYRAGDVVRHRELGEEWGLACDEKDGRIAACGWPEGWTRVEEVELVEAATDEHRLEVLTRVARENRDSRGAAAKAQLQRHHERHVDLELVKLRAEVRKWEAVTTRDSLTIIPTTIHGSLIFLEGKGLIATGRDGDLVAPLLTAPRWTIERLFAEPPEGWTSERCPCGNAAHPGWLHWGREIVPARDQASARHEATLEVMRFTEGMGCVPFIAGRGPAARTAEAMSAAAELAHILAEIRP